MNNKLIRIRQYDIKMIKSGEDSEVEDCKEKQNDHIHDNLEEREHQFLDFFAGIWDSGKFNQQVEKKISKLAHIQSSRCGRPFSGHPRTQGHLSLSRNEDRR